MNFSFSIQQAVAGGTVVDIGYAGSLGRNLVWTRNANAIPFGTNFRPENADPSSPGTPLPETFLRPYRGYGDVLIREYADPRTTTRSRCRRTAVLERRAIRCVLTWSKALDYASAEGQSVSNLVNPRVWNYGLGDLDRTHVLKANWLWDVPPLRSGNGVMRSAFSNWQMSGIASFVSGSPLGVGFSQVRATDITGSPTDGARIVVTGNPVLPKSERTFSRNFRTEVFALPAQGTIGNAARTVAEGTRHQQLGPRRA